MGGRNLFEKFKTSSPWHLLWISFVISEFLVALFNVFLGVLRDGHVGGRLLLIGAVDALVASAVISTIIVQFILKEQRRTEEALRRSSRFLSDVFESIRDPFSVFTNDFRIVKVNSEYAALKGRSVEELTGDMRCYEIQGRASVCEGCVVQKTMLSANPCAKEKRLRLSDGSDIWVEIYTYPILDADARVSHVIEYVRDTTGKKAAEMERKRFIEKLEQLSRSDDLTGLLNKRALMERLEYEVDRARRYHAPLSLISCDLDNFKQVNDTLGHEAGDRVLQIVAQALSGALRKSDIIGRMGGDEFLLILPQTPLEGAGGFAERMRQTVENITYPTDITVRPTLSLGLAAYEGIPDPNEILKCADVALYGSKRAGKNRVSF
ncbi:MAG: diguanylate cyclase [Nitrospiraceae bacterium]|nr:diguanylate cyclase [Nitrospiraceae bacterium]